MIFCKENYDKKGMNIETTLAVSMGHFSTPPKVEDVQKLVLPPGDLKDLANCKPGNCKVKLPEAAFEKIQRLSDSISDFEGEMNIRFRRAIIEYVQRYMIQGNTALIEYYDSKRPVRMAEQFKELLRKSTYVFKVYYLKGFNRTFMKKWKA